MLHSEVLAVAVSPTMQVVKQIDSTLGEVFEGLHCKNMATLHNFRRPSGTAILRCVGSSVHKMSDLFDLIITLTPCRYVVLFHEYQNYSLVLNWEASLESS